MTETLTGNDAQAQWKMLEAVTGQGMGGGPVSKQLLEIFVVSGRLDWLVACRDHLLTWKIFHGALAPHWVEGRRRKHSSDLSDRLQEDVTRVRCSCDGRGCEECEGQREDWAREAYCWSVGFLASNEAEARLDPDAQLETIPWEIHAFFRFFIYYISRTDSSRLHSVITGGKA